MTELASGQIVADRFEVISLLGSGGMAEVFLARDTDRPEGAAPVVLKRIFPHLAKRLDFVRMFGDEARIALRLRHENIAQVQDVVVHDDIPVLVRAKLLKSLGNPAPNAPKYFASCEVEKLAADPDWLNKATKAISSHWRKKNAHRHCQVAEIQKA